jgi:23S rRNA pseudouridine2605 synthase
MSEEADPQVEPERVQKVLAKIGLGSRRASETLISEGRVTVNGRVVELGARVGPEDELAVDGTVYSTRPDAVTYLLNKPAGVVTTASDPEGRPTVVELVPTEPRVFPVGRLDLNTEGLLLLTNDGGLAHRLTHPSFGIEKEYLVEVKGKIARSSLRVLREGVELDDGKTSPAKASLLDSGLLRLTIHEGRNRQVRRMCEAIGHPVVRLVRSRIGPIVDPKLKPGFSRPLSGDELLQLQRAVESRR